MTRTIIAPAGFVLGDGTTATSVASERWRRSRWMVGLVGAAIITIVLAAVVPLQTDSTHLSVRNPGDNGARALAEILRDHGVSVTQTYYLERTAEILGPQDTLVIAATDYYIDPGQAESIAKHPGPIVWLGPDFQHLEAFDTGLTLTRDGGDGVRRTDCSAAAAVKAERIISLAPRDISTTTASSAVQLCFAGSRAGSGAYAIVTSGGRTVHLFADEDLVTNLRLADEGNAALAINAIGSTDRVVWYNGSLLDDTILALPEDARASDYLDRTAPEWLDTVGLMLILATAVALLWRGRRLGKLVTEPLPVVVRAAETTRGRGRLYQSSNSRGHATAALRAGAISRMARRLALPQTSGADTVIPAIAGATGFDSVTVEALLYGPPPRSDEQMIHLVKELDTLERKVEPL